jgi:hypothetical protein
MTHFRTQEILSYGISDKCLEILFAVMEAWCDEADERIMLGDNTGRGAVMQRPVRFWCVGIWQSYAVDHLYLYVLLIADMRRIFWTVATAGKVCDRNLL